MWSMWMWQWVNSGYTAVFREYLEQGSRRVLARESCDIHRWVLRALDPRVMTVEVTGTQLMTLSVCTFPEG